MEMARSRSGGGGKVVTFDDAVAGRRRHVGSLSSYLDIGTGNNKDAVIEAGRAARPWPAAPGMGSRRRTYADDDGELDVFAAESYFKGAMDGNVGGGRKEAFAGAAAAVAPVETTAAVVMARPSSTRASTVSFTTASSASSATANSQTALFRSRRHGSGGRRCCVQVGVLVRTCSGKRSVRVDDGRAAAAAAKGAAHGGSGEPAASGVDWYRELRMQKAALGLPGDVGTAKVAAIGREMTTLATTREEKAAAELARSGSVRRSVTLVAPVRASNNMLPASGGGGGGKGAGAGEEKEEEEYDGAGSESSSDLFEIKSLMIEECCPYEPSEASIQWSVVTASAADAASEHRGDRATRRAAGSPYRDNRPVGLLAGCTSHRAVDVSAATKGAPAMQRRTDGFHKARNGGA